MKAQSTVNSKVKSFVEVNEKIMPTIRAELLKMKLKVNKKKSNFTFFLEKYHFLCASMRYLYFQQLTLESRLKRINSTERGGSRRLRGLLMTLSKQVDKLYKLIKKDECDDKPCSNGGTCLDLFGGYHCLCPSHFKVSGAVL